MTVAVNSPRDRSTPATWCANAFDAPYGLTGRIGVRSSWGEVAGSPKISALLGCSTRTSRPRRSWSRRAASIRVSAAMPLTRVVSRGSSHERATELTPPRL